MDERTRKLVELTINQHDDGAAYTLLTEDFRPMLCKVMRHYGIPQEAEYDLLMDFYLYLRDGKGEEADRRFPYSMLMSLQSIDAFPSWLKVVFVRWIEKRFGKSPTTEEISERLADEMGENEDLSFSFSDIQLAILVLEKVNETFSAPERLIFFSDLYAIINKVNPRPELCRILNVKDGNLRVMQTRVKKKVKVLMKQIQQSLA